MRILTLSVLVLSSLVLVGQKKTLFTYNDQTVSVDDFLYVYEKNNRNDTNYYSQASIDEYLDLYVNFKLKVEEAKSLKLDTTAAFKKELKQYKDQLAASYLYDREITEELIQEAYDRTKKEMRVAHLLIRVDENAPPADTLRAFEKIKKVKAEIDAGLNFTEAAQKYSEDPSVHENKGDLGFISAFQTIYPFETAAYSTKMGKISEPIRTKFGYHLVKAIDSRPAKGEVNCSHILIKIPRFASLQLKKNYEKTIKNLRFQLKQGADFAMLAKRQSEDRTTARNGGHLGWFGSGQMVEEFEEMAFELEKPGDISKPFVSRHGWHIIKLNDKREVGSYEDMRDLLKEKVQRDGRSKVAKEVFLQNVKDQYGFKEHRHTKEHFATKVNESIRFGNWKYQQNDGLKHNLFELNGKEYTQQDFAEFIVMNQRVDKEREVKEIVFDFYDQYLERSLITLEESQLDKKYPEFSKLMNEYHDGILLFELTNQKVWKRASEDEGGLRAFYNENKKNYMWDKRIKASIIEIRDKSIVNEFRRRITRKNAQVNQVVSGFNVPGKSKKVIVKSDVFEKGDNDIVDSVRWQKGVSRHINTGPGSTTLVVVEEVIPPTEKSIEDARGYLISDYQAVLEKEWVEELRSKYSVDINTKELQKIYKKATK